ncbi:YfcE family phosphodiesterase [Acidobacteria bacterium AH-259-L09]|nr:YfcE family phosphodiesterase [Acidobacteria bacterium AH-259-L09]
MKLAIFSDIHDNIWKLDKALTQMAEAEVLIHCGDLCSPFVVKRLGEAAKGRPVHIVWGNNDGDIRLICQVGSQYSEVHLHGALAELELDGLKVAVNHYPEIARPLAASGSYDLVCYGHDHTAYEGRTGKCVLLNPGELMGLYGKTTFAFFDTQSRSVQFVEVR